MKNKLILISILSGVSFTAQTHRFIYDVEYKKDSTTNIMTKENYHLDISPKSVTYYTRDYFTADSLIVNNSPFPETLKLESSNILKHDPASNDFHEYDLLENTVLDVLTVDKQNWKLSTEKKKIKKLSLQKAETDWGGRHWTAWFAEELPFQEGPYKFHGLPGLIVELKDDGGNYKFELVRSQNIKGEYKNQFIQMAQQMSVPVNWEKYRDTKLKYYNAPISFIKNGRSSTSSSQFFLNDGTVVSPQNERDINLRLQKTLKTYNNPIDLSKAIPYP